MYGIDFSFDRQKILKLTADKYKNWDLGKELILECIDEVLNSELFFIKDLLNEETVGIDYEVSRDEAEMIKSDILKELYPQGIEEEISEFVVKKLLEISNPENIFSLERIGYKGFKGENFDEIKFSFNVRKIIKLFEKKRIQAIKKNSKLGNKYLLQEHLNNLAIGTSKELKEHDKRIIDKRKKECLSILQMISNLKEKEIKIRVAIEQFIYSPQTKEEYKEFEEIVKVKIKEVFGENTEDYMSDLLVNAWMRKKEVEMEEEDKKCKLE